MCHLKYEELESGSGQLEKQLSAMESLVDMTENVLDGGENTKVRNDDQEI